MTGPFIFIATNRLKEGKLESEKQCVPGLVDFVEANEPRLIAPRRRRRAPQRRAHFLGGLTR